MLNRLLTFLWLLFAGAACAQTTLVGGGSVWKYLDNGSDQGTAWRAANFDDSAWRSGPAQLGYGDGDEATVVSYGPNASAKYITTYFRRAFAVANPAAFVSLPLRVKRDDGVVLYLNGSEVWRSNMPAGAPTYLTRAASVASDDGATWQTATLNPALLIAGTNVLAAEVHQADPTSSDISFDLELLGATTTTVTRGPYLQMGTASGVQVRWRTDAATDSVVRYGTSPTSLSAVATDATATTEHAVTLGGLAGSTRYYYSVGSTAATLAGADADHYFVTAPAPGTARPTRVWVLGDAGTGNTTQLAVRNAYEAFAGTRHTDLWLQLGDNAYNSGTDAEYQANMFDVYRSMLRKSVTWPTIGNHDTAQSTNPAATLPYFQMFSFPTAGQAGGVASGTKKYYSFDFGDIHFICLDSMSSSRAPGSPMLTWLQSDLAANTKAWTIAFWHHPPYTKGTHDSDTEIELIEMRTNVLPILESFGVDMVLAGHSHVYERSYLIDSHYGSSSTFTASMKKDGGSGRPGETGAYRKPLGSTPHAGAVYAVAGSSGQTGSGTLNHPAMFISMPNAGSMVLDFDGGRLDATFLASDGAVRDSFSMVKGAATNQPPVVAMTSPSPGATFQAPASIALTASANDPDGSVARVEYYNGTTLIGSSTTAPAYGATWSNVPAGSYTLSARALDNAGASTTSATVGVSVTAPAATMSVGNITMTLKVAANGKSASAQAAVTVRDAGGQALPAAAVTGVWSGVVSGSASGNSGTSGVATFTSPVSRKRGTFTFTVTGITLSGYGYQPAANAETSDSVVY